MNDQRRRQPLRIEAAIGATPGKLTVKKFTELFDDRILQADDRRQIRVRTVEGTKQDARHELTVHGDDESVRRCGPALEERPVGGVDMGVAAFDDLLLQAV